MDENFFKKYSVSGPRYTSYPTAPHFQEKIDQKEIKSAIKKSFNNGKELSLYVHLPYCDTLCYFCACNMIRSNNRERISRYLKYLYKEMEIYSSLINPTQKVVQMHWGGGTPSHLNPDEILETGEKINTYFNISEKAELSVEVDPRGLTDDHLNAFREIGMNRISMGVQDFDEKVQKAVNRVHKFTEIESLFEKIHMRGFRAINLDLMYGLPYQSTASFHKTLDKVLKLKPDRIALFHFAYLPEIKKHQRLILQETLPSSEEKLAIFVQSYERLIEEGYQYIGMDHFALPNDDLAIALKNKTMTRNFQGYSTKKNTDIIAMGITGISQVENLYFQNQKTENNYFEAIENKQIPVLRGYLLEKEDEMIREIIMTLMCDLHLDIKEIEQKYMVRFNQEFANEIQKLEPFKKDGLIEIKKDTIQVSEKGRYAIRNIVMVFDRFLAKDQKIHYSKTI